MLVTTYVLIFGNLGVPVAPLAPPVPQALTTVNTNGSFQVCKSTVLKWVSYLTHAFLTMPLDFSDEFLVPGTVLKSGNVTLGHTKLSQSTLL